MKKTQQVPFDYNNEIFCLSPAKSTTNSQQSLPQIVKQTNIKKSTKRKIDQKKNRIKILKRQMEITKQSKFNSIFCQYIRENYSKKQNLN